MDHPWVLFTIFFFYAISALRFNTHFYAPKQIKKKVIYRLVLFSHYSVRSSYLLRLPLLRICGEKVRLQINTLLFFAPDSQSSTEQLRDKISRKVSERRQRMTCSIDVLVDILWLYKKRIQSYRRLIYTRTHTYICIF